MGGPSYFLRDGLSVSVKRKKIHTCDGQTGGCFVESEGRCAGPAWYWTDQEVAATIESSWTETWNDDGLAYPRSSTGVSKKIRVHSPLRGTMRDQKAEDVWDQDDGHRTEVYHRLAQSLVCHHQQNELLHQFFGAFASGWAFGGKHSRDIWS